jgi:hypothetical protein
MHFSYQALSAAQLSEKKLLGTAQSLLMTGFRKGNPQIFLIFEGIFYLDYQFLIGGVGNLRIFSEISEIERGRSLKG